MGLYNVSPMAASDTSEIEHGLNHSLLSVHFLKSTIRKLIEVMSTLLHP